MTKRSTRRQNKNETTGEGSGAPSKRTKSGRSTASTSTKILDLNDDCLDQVFSYVSYDDVLQACQVCHRFEDRARAAFKRQKYNSKLFTIKANESHRLLRRIGPALLKLEIFFGQDLPKNQQIIDIATKYCNDNLTEITFHCLTKRNKLRRSFDRVNKLTLSFCDLIGHFKLIKWFPNLSSLTYHHTKNLKKFMKQSLPSLHTLNINFVTSQVETVAMLASNPQIKNLSLKFASSGLVLKQNLVHAIDSALPELEALNLVIERIPNFQEAGDLSSVYFKHLKMLSVENCSDYSNTSLINHLQISPASLERLHLRFSDESYDSHSYNCITKYKQLRVLCVMPSRHSLSAGDILMLANQLPLLEKVEQIVDFVNVVPWTSDEVANFLRNSKQVMELTFVFDFDAHAKFSRTSDVIRTQFNGSDWSVNMEPRLAMRYFDTGVVNGEMRKQWIISVTKRRLI